MSITDIGSSQSKFSIWFYKESSSLSFNEWLKKVMSAGGRSFLSSSFVHLGGKEGESTGLDLCAQRCDFH